MRLSLPKVQQSLDICAVFWTPARPKTRAGPKTRVLKLRRPNPPAASELRLAAPFNNFSTAMSLKYSLKPLALSATPGSLVGPVGAPVRRNLSKRPSCLRLGSRGRRSVPSRTNAKRQRFNPRSSNFRVAFAQLGTSTTATSGRLLEGEEAAFLGGIQRLSRFASKALSRSQATT